MVAPNQLFQSGRARAFLQHEPWSMTYRLYVSIEDDLLRFDNHGGIILEPMEEGVKPSNDNATLAWTENVEDEVVDVFKAICKALELYSEGPGQAYKQGFAEGEAKVLREWNESLRG